MKNRNFVYPASLIRDEVDGGYLVRFPDFPEAITDGDSIKEALVEAAAALEEAVAGRISDGESIPRPSRRAKDQYLVAVPAQTAAKAALYLAMRQAKVSKVRLAALLGCDEKEVRRLLDPHHRSQLPRMAAAAEAPGKRLAVQLVDQPVQD